MENSGAEGTLKLPLHCRSLGTPTGTGLSFSGILFHQVMNGEPLTQVVKISSKTWVICMWLSLAFLASSWLVLSAYISNVNSSLGSHNGGPEQRSLPVWCSMTPWRVAVSVPHTTPTLIIPLLQHLTHDTSPSALLCEEEGERLGSVPGEKLTKDPESTPHGSYRDCE